MTPIHERVYIGRDNYSDVEFSQGRNRPSPIDLSEVTRMVLTLTPGEITDAVPEIVVDSDVDADSIDWETTGAGIVRFSLGDVAGVDNQQYNASLVMYDAAHTDGQVLIDGEYPIRLVFTFYEV